MRLLVISARDLRWLLENETLAQRVQENLDKHTGGNPGRDQSEWHDATY
jgi:hypothetical protein